MELHWMIFVLLSRPYMHRWLSLPKFRKKIFSFKKKNLSSCDLLYIFFIFRICNVCSFLLCFSTGFRWSRIRYWLPSCLSRRKNLSFWTKKIRWSSHVSDLLVEFLRLSNASGLSAGQGNLALLIHTSVLNDSIWTFQTVLDSGLS